MTLLGRQFGQLVDNALVGENVSLQVIDPATEQVIGVAPSATFAEFDRAATAATKIFPVWKATSWQHRRELVQVLADILEANAAELAMILTFEQGRPILQAEMEVRMAAAFVRTVAAMELKSITIADEPGRRVTMCNDPLGVVAAITPWNGPIALASVKLANALLAGNCVILKPSPFTPLATLSLGALLQTLFPAGVLNILSGGAELGSWMTTDPRIAKITFTGSTLTGKQIAAAAAPTLKRLTLELGGNDAAIVLDDVDPGEAAAAIADRAFANAGQFCAGIKRVYVASKIYDSFCQAMAAKVSAIRVGNGFDDGIEMGPVQNRPQLARVMDLLEDALRRGRAIAGGRRLEGPGYFVEPTVIVDVAEGVRLVDEEQFGPVLPVMAFATEDEAIDRANRGPYGLGGSVWSAHTGRAVDICKRLEVGTSWVNQHGMLHAGTPLPFAKDSGFGIDYGVVGLAEFTQRHVINVKL